MSRLTLHILALSAFALVPSCSSAFHPRACKTDDDCGGGVVCVEEQNAAAVCKNAADAPLRIGMSAPISGPSQDLGTEMRKGVLLAFDAQNAAGVFAAAESSSNSATTNTSGQRRSGRARSARRQRARQLAGPLPSTTAAITAGSTPVAPGALLRGANAVLGLVGSVGTPTMVRSAPIAVETGSLFFGAFTGASKSFATPLRAPARVTSSTSAPAMPKRHAPRSNIS